MRMRTKYDCCVISGLTDWETGKRKLTLCLQFIVSIFLCVSLPKPPVWMFAREGEIPSQRVPASHPRLVVWPRGGGCLQQAVLAWPSITPESDLTSWLGGWYEADWSCLPPHLSHLAPLTTNSHVRSGRFSPQILSTLSFFALCYLLNIFIQNCVEFCLI